MILISYERELKNYFGKSYVYLKDFSYFSSLYTVMDEWMSKEILLTVLNLWHLSSAVEV
jgi:hypothetical protein